MTAIAGFWSLDGRPALEPVKRVLNGQKAYGLQSSYWHGRGIGLGRNLYRLLPEDAFDNGPLHDDHYALVADLRLDNREELGGALRLAKSGLDVLSDAALLFRCLLKWGDETPDRLTGEFAFAWWDGKQRRLLLCRDILGYRPLHFHRGDRFFAFASMPSGLHALPNVPLGFDSEFMAESLALLPRHDSRTHFHAIERVQPAHMLWVEAEKESSVSYWNPASPVERHWDSRAYEEEARRLVDVAVSAQLRGAGGIAATHLSSGLDSAIVTSSAALQFAPEPILAFTAVPARDFDGPTPANVIANEGPGAASLANRYRNIEQILVESGGASPLEALEREHFYHQQPVANLENAVWGRAMIRAASARGAKVLLTGSVGNLTVTYAGFEYLGSLIRKGRLAKGLGLSRAFARAGIGHRTLLAQLVGPFLPTPAWTMAAKLHGRVIDLRDYTSISAASVAKVKEQAQKIGFDLTYRPSSDPFQARLDALSDVDAGNYAKGVLAEWGVSVRDPLADKRLIEFCLSTPAEEFTRGGVPRSLARRAFAERLPVETVTRLARGYQSPDWYVALDDDRDRLRHEAQAIGRCAAAAEAMNLDWVRNAVETWPSAGWTNTDVLMRYRYGLLRAISAGHFMRRVAGSN